MNDYVCILPVNKKCNYTQWGKYNKKPSKSDIADSEGFLYYYIVYYLIQQVSLHGDPNGVDVVICVQLDIYGLKDFFHGIDGQIPVFRDFIAR